MTAARSGARILWTPREVSRTDRESSTSQDVHTAVATVRLTLQIPNFISTSKSSTRTWTEDIFIPRWSIIPQRRRNANPLGAPINRFPAVHAHPTPVYRKAIGPITVPEESADIYMQKSLDIGSNSVVAKSPNFMDFRLSPANTTYKLKSIIVLTIRVKRLMNGPNLLVSGNVIGKITVEKVSEAKAFSDYILKN